MYSIKTFDSIRYVPREHWNALVSLQSCAYSYEFWEVLEASKLNDFTYTHALIYDDGGSPVGVASFYTLTTDIAIFSTGWIKGTLGFIRKFFPGFLKFRMLECGTPITVGKPFISSVGSNEDEILRCLEKTLYVIAKEQGAFVVVMRDIEPLSVHLESHLISLNYHLVASLPNTYMEITWSSPDEYLASLKSHYRRKILIHQKVNESCGIRYKLCDDFTDLADTLCNQWLVVHEKAIEFKRERLSPEFFAAFSDKLGSRSKVLLFYRREELVSHVLLLLDGETLRWLYVGRNESIKDNLYFYMCHKIVETAILLKVKRLELGLTTYEPKMNLGARMLPVKIAIKTTNSFFNIFAGFFYALLNDTPEIKTRNIFKRCDGEIAA